MDHYHDPASTSLLHMHMQRGANASSGFCFVCATSFCLHLRKTRSKSTSVQEVYTLTRDPYWSFQSEDARAASLLGDIARPPVLLVSVSRERPLVCPGRLGDFELPVGGTLGRQPRALWSLPAARGHPLLWHSALSSLVIYSPPPSSR